MGKYMARLGQGQADLAQALALRSQCFRARAADMSDEDSYDAACLHVLIEDTATETLVCCYRVMILVDAAAVARSYSAQFYDLSQLAGFGGPMLELGRFCVHPGHQDGDILRLAWGALARLVDQSGAQLLFGCSSFAGVHGPDHDAALAWLRAHHLAPPRWRALRKSTATYDFGNLLASHTANLRAAMHAMPPLLRTYLAMGGWVSDHAVVDNDLNTLHVFTAVEIAKIPEPRARALRAIAG